MARTSLAAWMKRWPWFAWQTISATGHVGSCRAGPAPTMSTSPRNMHVYGRASAKRDPQHTHPTKKAQGSNQARNTSPHHSTPPSPQTHEPLTRASLQKQIARGSRDLKSLRPLDPNLNPTLLTHQPTVKLTPLRFLVLLDLVLRFLRFGFGAARDRDLRRLVNLCPVLPHEFCGHLQFLCVLTKISICCQS